MQDRFAAAVAEQRRSLILYATPSGALGKQCQTFFDAVQHRAPTEAQHYPPHCTLTGFFHPPEMSLTPILEVLPTAQAECGPAPTPLLGVTALARNEGWIGLELSSPWLTQLSHAFARHADPHTNGSQVRVKTWLHLSLAYGPTTHRDLDWYWHLSQELIDVHASVDWKIAVWERTLHGAWITHSA